MDVDRPPHPRDYPSSSREGPSRGPTGHQTLLLHHPVPPQQVQAAELRNSAVHGPGQYNDRFHGRPLRVPLSSTINLSHVNHMLSNDTRLSSTVLDRALVVMGTDSIFLKLSLHGHPSTSPSKDDALHGANALLAGATSMPLCMWLV